MMVNTSMKMNLKKSKQFLLVGEICYLFLRSDNSYHSVDLNNISERKSIQIAIYYKNKKPTKAQFTLEIFRFFWS